MYESAGENPLASPVAQIDKSTAWDVEGIVPTIGVLIFLCFLYPLENLVNRLEVNFAVSQTDLIQVLGVALSSTLPLA